MGENERIDPCDICKAEAKSFMIKDAPTNEWVYYIGCTNPRCGDETPRFPTVELAIERWNSGSLKKINTTLTEENTHLKERLKEVSSNVFEIFKMAERDGVREELIEKIADLSYLLPVLPSEDPCLYCWAPGEVVLLDTDTWCVECSSIYCGARGPIEETAEEAIEKWNQRYKLLKFRSQGD